MTAYLVPPASLAMAVFATAAGAGCNAAAQVREDMEDMKDADASAANFPAEGADHRASSCAPLDTYEDIFEAEPPESGFFRIKTVPSSSTKNLFDLKGLGDDDVAMERDEDSESHNILPADVLARMVKDHTGLVHSIAREFAYAPIPLMDLVQEGMVGLMKAIHRYDPEIGKLSTYAVHWIRSEIRRHVKWQSATVRFTENVYQDRRTLFIARAAFIREYGTEPTTEDLSNATGFSREQIHAITATEHERSMPIDRKTSSRGSSGEGLSILDQLESHSMDANELSDLFVALPRFLSALPPDQRRVIELVYGLDEDHLDADVSTHEAGAIIGISHEAVRKKRDQAIATLTEFVTEARRPEAANPWLEDDELKSGIMRNLSPMELKIFSMTYERWTGVDKAASSLGVDTAEYRILRKALMRKVGGMISEFKKAG